MLRRFRLRHGGSLGSMGLNRLPWRERKKAYQALRLRQSLMGSVLLSLLILAVMHVALGILVTHASACEARLQAERQLLSEKAERIQRWEQQQSTMRMVRQEVAEYQRNLHAVMLTLGRHAKPSICLTRMVRMKNEMTLSGYARSVSDVLAIMNQIRNTHVFSDMALDRLRHETGKSVFHFVIKATEAHVISSGLQAQEALDNES